MNAKFTSALFLVLLLGCGARAQTTFTYQNSFSPGWVASSITLEDVVGGPLADILMTNFSGNSLRILDNAGLSTVPTFMDIAVAAAPRGVIVVDVDADGDRDIATISNSVISMLVKNGGTFTRTDYTMTGTSRVDIVDLNGDGWKDLVRGDSVRWATAPGVFGPSTTLVATSPFSVQATFVADFDGDGDADFGIQTGGIPASFVVMKNNGQGSFAAGIVSPIPVTDSIPTMNVKDLNGDGAADLACTFLDTPASSVGIFTMLSNANATMTASDFVRKCENGDLPYFCGSPVFSDLDADGDQDVVWISVFSSFGSIYLDWLLTARNDGNGILDSVRVATGGSLTSWAGDSFGLGDLDGDGDPDLLRRRSGPPPGTNVNVYLGSPTPPANVAASISPVAGGSMTVPTSATVVQPIVVEVRDALGNPVAGAPTLLTQISGPSLADIRPCFSQSSDAAGRVSFEILTSATPGIIVLEIGVANGPSVQVTLDAQPLLLTPIGGGQTITIAGNPPLPLTPPTPMTIVVTHAVTGLPVANVPVRIEETIYSAPRPVFSLPATVISDSNGVAAWTPAPIRAGSASAAATIGTAFAAPYAGFTVIGPSISITSGALQATDAGETFFSPIEAMVVDYAGNPVAGYPVTFARTAGPSGSVAFATPTLTDAQGRASTIATSTAIAGGSVSGAADLFFAAAPATFSLFTRFLTINGSATNGGITVTYAHEDGPTPLILAVDQPQPSSISTPYGTIHTSVLAPAPTLLLADPQGLVGTFDPGLVANPTFSRTYAIPPAAAGYTFVAQIYGFDPTYYPDLSQAIFVSNAVTKTL